MANRYQSRSDAALLRRARRDPDGFVTVCRRHGEGLQMWLQRELGDDLLAQELLADTFAAAWPACGRFRDQGEGAAPWLHGIARNLVRRLRRDEAIETRARQRLGLPTLEPDDFEPIIERLGAGQEFETFSEEFARLPAEQREALELRGLLGTRSASRWSEVTLRAERSQTIANGKAGSTVRVCQWAVVLKRRRAPFARGVHAIRAITATTRGAAADA